MAEVSNDLIDDMPRGIRGRMSEREHMSGEIDIRLGSISPQIQGLSLGLNATRTDVAKIHHSLGRLERRITRIDTRLDIIEEPAD